MNFKTWKERSKEELNILSRVIDCPHHPKVIIGRGGENIKKIQNATNTRIKISRHDNTIHIMGYNEENLDRAVQEIEDSNRMHSYNNRMHSDDNRMQSEENTVPSFNLQDDFPTLGSTVCVHSPRKKLGYWNK